MQHHTNHQETGNILLYNLKFDTNQERQYLFRRVTRKKKHRIKIGVHLKENNTPLLDTWTKSLHTLSEHSRISSVDSSKRFWKTILRVSPKIEEGQKELLDCSEMFFLHPASRSRSCQGKIRNQWSTYERNIKENCTLKKLKEIYIC